MPADVEKKIPDFNEMLAQRRQETAIKSAVDDAFNEMRRKLGLDSEAVVREGFKAIRKGLGLR